MLTVLLLTALSMVACGSDGSGASLDKVPTIPPTFARIAVTPIPTATPVPTIPPTETPIAQTKILGAPVFPLELDPGHVDDRPEDEAIFAGWTEFLRNTQVHYEEFDQAIHLCSKGLLLHEFGPYENLANWRVTRSPAISSYDWGTISIEVDITGGRWEGREWAMLTINRFEGGFTVINNYTPGPVEFTRSEKCLSL